MLRALRLLALGVLLSVLAVPAGAADATSVWDEVEHHFAQNQGVKIHYVTLGKGPTVLFVHGFPDFWYSWRDQMAALSGEFRTAAIDLRGYNQSDQPAGHRELPPAAHPRRRRRRGARPGREGDPGRTRLGRRHRLALRDDASGERRAAGHPQPHAPARIRGGGGEPDRRPARQHRVRAPLRDFASPTARRCRTGILAMGDRFGPEIGARYREAFGRSSYDGMLNYYRANYGQASGAGVETPNLPMPVLQFHGLKDAAVDKDGLKNTWDWIAADYTLVTIPSSGHWVQSEASELVSATMKAWLLARN